MGRKKEVLNALESLGIEYNELDSGEVLFKHGEGSYWFHPDDSKPECVTVNKVEEYHTGDIEKPRLSDVVNEINKSVPGIKALIIEDEVMLNCDLFPGRHRLCPSDIEATIGRLEAAGKFLSKLLDEVITNRINKAYN